MLIDLDKPVSLLFPEYLATRNTWISKNSIVIKFIKYWHFKKNQAKSCVANSWFTFDTKFWYWLVLIHINIFQSFFICQLITFFLTWNLITNTSLFFTHFNHKLMYISQRINSNVVARFLLLISHNKLFKKTMNICCEYFHWNPVKKKRIMWKFTQFFFKY